MGITLRLNSGEVFTLGVDMSPEVWAKYEALLPEAFAHAEARQTIPRNSLVVYEAGQELGLWTILAMPPIHDVDDGRVF